MGSPEEDSELDYMEKAGWQVKKIKPVVKALWLNRKAEIAIVTSIIALVRPLFTG